MKVKIGDINQLYGPDSALAGKIRHDVIIALEKQGVIFLPIYTGMRGPDVWAAVHESQVEKLEIVAPLVEHVGEVMRKRDDEGEEYMDIPLIYEPRQRRVRRSI